MATYQIPGLFTVFTPRVGEDQDYAESDERFYQAPIPEGSAVMDSCNLISLYVVI